MFTLSEFLLWEICPFKQILSYAFLSHALFCGLVLAAATAAGVSDAAPDAGSACSAETADGIAGHKTGTCQRKRVRGEVERKTDTLT